MCVCVFVYAVPPQWRDRPGGKEWDTIKPLTLHGCPLASTVLVDNDDHKCVPGEERNMLLVPDWMNDAGESRGGYYYYYYYLF